MLKSNWSEGLARLFGCRVIRQRTGRAPPRRSNAEHVFLTRSQRETVCAELEWRAQCAAKRV
jgi:hypothetical protein